jgi:hypothetical protein
MSDEVESAKEVEVNGKVGEAVDDVETAVVKAAESTESVALKTGKTLHERFESLLDLLHKHGIHFER